MSTSQTGHSRGAKGETATAVALPVVLYVDVGQVCRRRLVGEGLGIGNAEFGGYAVVGEEEGQSMACT
jgi:hypothetical protein